MKIKVLIFFFFLIYNNIFAEKDDSSNTKVQNDGFIPLPLVIYTPETKFAGIFAGYYYKHFNKEIPDSKPLELNGYLLYSQKNQIVVKSEIINYFIKNDILVKADFMFNKFYDIYWGIGPNSKENDDEEFSFNQYRLRLGLMYQIAPLVYAGLSYHYFNYDIRKFEMGGKIDLERPIGYNDALISGPGIHIFSDKTNSVFFPTKGYNYDIKFNYFSKIFGSSTNFWRSEIDFRYFYELLKENVVGVNSVIMLTGGDVPFVKLPLYGGMQIGRGFYEGRYRDKLLYSAQSEYRFPIYWRFAGAAFISAGDVAPNFDSFKIEYLKVAYGLGIRFIADRKEHIAIRLDVANSSQGIQFYLNIKEAF